MAQESMTPLLDLAETISKSALFITKSQLQDDSPPPSFKDFNPKRAKSVNGAMKPSAQGPPHKEMIAARQTLSQAAADLLILTMGPANFLKSFAFGIYDMTALSVVLEFNIAKSVPIVGDISFTGLAKSVGFSGRKLERILRFLFVRKIFWEPRPGFVGHTAVSAYLADNEELAAFLGHCAGEAFPAASMLSTAIKSFPYTEEPNEAGFNLALNTSDPLFSFMGKNPERFDRFNLGQAGISQGTGRDTQQAVEGYDWASLGSATVVDVGGGNGHISIALAQAYPSLNLIVQDLPDAVAIGVASLPPQLASRITFQDHDIFSPQPVKHADAYYLRHILHDWPDKQAIMILKALVPALKHGKSRVLISDTVIPPPGVLSGLDEKFVRCVDMQMMVLHNSRERTVEDFKALVSAADKGLVFEKVWKKGVSGAATLFEVRYGGGGESKTEPFVGGMNGAGKGVVANGV